MLSENCTWYADAQEDGTIEITAADQHATLMFTVDARQALRLRDCLSKALVDLELGFPAPVGEVRRVQRSHGCLPVNEEHERIVDSLMPEPSSRAIKGSGHE